MRRMCILLSALAMVLGGRTQAQAAMINLGADSLGNRLIYDSDFDITWYDYVHSWDDWQGHVNWAQNLTVTFGGKQYSGWRLPTTVDGTPVDPSGPPPAYYNGTGPNGYNITTSEMGHLYYTELGNKGHWATDGTFPQPGWGLINKGPFLNLTDGLIGGIYAVYDSGTSHSVFDSWFFSFYDGWQDQGSKVGGAWALAVHPGIVGSPPVPEPGTLLLLGFGLIGLAGCGRKKFSKK